jgi:hypothetical protein
MTDWYVDQGLDLPAASEEWREAAVSPRLAE